MYDKETLRVSQNFSTPASPLNSVITEANTLVVVFDAYLIWNVADIINTNPTETLYIDFVQDVEIGQATSIPILPGQSYRISHPISTRVTAVSTLVGHSFVAVRY